MLKDSLSGGVKRHVGALRVRIIKKKTVIGLLYV